MPVRCSSSSCPMVVLQSVVAFMFVERQWSVVNYYLSSAVTREIATLIDVYKTYPQGADRAQLRRIAQERLGLVGRLPSRDAIAAAGPEAILLAARRDVVRRDPQADQAAVLDRHGRPFLDRGNPHQARRHDHAGVCAARRRLRFNSMDFPAVDGRHLAGRAHHRHFVSAQPDPPHRASLPTPRKPSARAARFRISVRAARARCGAQRRLSWK